MSPRRRRVHFGDEQSESSSTATKEKVEILGPLLTPSSEMSILDKRNLWWQPKEFDAFLEDAKILASESRKFDSENDTGCYAEVIRNVYWSCKDSKAKGPTRKQLNKLSQWTKVAHTRRGLERVCVPGRFPYLFHSEASLIRATQLLTPVCFFVIVEVGVTRSRQKRDVIRGVLRAQRRLQKNGSQEDKEVLLSMVSKTLTRPARLYAAVMGEADAHASGVLEKEQTVMEELRSTIGNSTKDTTGKNVVSQVWCSYSSKSIVQWRIQVCLWH